MSWRVPTPKEWVIKPTDGYFMDESKPIKEWNKVAIVNLMRGLWSK